MIDFSGASESIIEISKEAKSIFLGFNRKKIFSRGSNQFWINWHEKELPIPVFCRLLIFLPHVSWPCEGIKY